MKVVVLVVLGLLVSEPVAPFDLEKKLEVHPRSLESVKDIIKSLNIQHPEVVYRQYVIESGWGTSNLAVTHNNLFGMKYPQNRPTTAYGKTSNGFAKYRSIRDSIIDYALWQSFYANNLSETEYLSYLSKVYAEDPKYIWKLIN